MGLGLGLGGWGWGWGRGWCSVWGKGWDWALECHHSPAPKVDLIVPRAKSVKAVMKTESWKW